MYFVLRLLYFGDNEYFLPFLPFPQKQLAKRRKQFAQRREEEKKEQELLREHEDNVVRYIESS